MYGRKSGGVGGTREGDGEKGVKRAVPEQLALIEGTRRPLESAVDNIKFVP